jgi:hypothetical protein
MTLTTTLTTNFPPIFVRKIVDSKSRRGRQETCRFNHVGLNLISEVVSKVINKVANPQSDDIIDQASTDSASSDAFFTLVE